MQNVSHSKLHVLLVALLLPLGALLVACGSDDGGSQSSRGPVTVKMREFEFTLDRGTWPAGTVDITVSNVGAQPHEMYLVRNLKANALPRTADGSVDRDAIASTEVVTVVPSMAPGTEQTVTLDLEPGTYVAVCNIINPDGTGHFMEGMHMPIVVE